MHSLLAVFLVVAQLNAPPTLNVVEQHQSADAAKIHNSLDKAVSFHYQFEDEKWRRRTIQPHSAAYIWYESPTRPLLVEYHDGRRYIRYRLPTATVAIHQTPSGSSEPDLQRYDEAQPYFFTSRNGGLSFYAGLNSGWVSAAAKSALATFAKRQIDVGMLSKQFDMMVVDPVIVEAEWGAAEEIINSEYRRWMRTPDSPFIEHYWERDHKWGRPSHSENRHSELWYAVFLRIHADARSPRHRPIAR